MTFPTYALTTYAARLPLQWDVDGGEAGGGGKLYDVVYAREKLYPSAAKVYLCKAMTRQVEDVCANLQRFINVLCAFS